MKFSLAILFTALFTLASIQGQQQVPYTPATIGLTTNANPQGYIRGSGPSGIAFSTTETGQPTNYSFTQIRGSGLDKLIRLEERSEKLANARAAFAEGNYAEAAQEFGAVADSHNIILHIPYNFAAEARFYQIESLRRLGRFNAIGPLLETEAGKSIEKQLPERYKEFTRMHKLWAIFGKGDMAELENAIASYQEPVVGKAKLLPTPNFKKMPQSELAQIAFMRAKIYDAKGEKDKALEDYYRVFSMTFAHEPFLSKQAMGAAMVIMAQNPALQSDDEKKKEKPLKTIQSVAYFFSKRFSDTPMPPQFQEYAVRPKVEPILAVKEKEPAEAKPGEGEGDAGKGKAKDSKGKDDDGKGKGKDTPKGKGKGKK